MEITVPTVTMITSTMMTLTVMVYTNRVGAVNEVKLCNNALGMESGLVADDQLTASSSFDDFIVGPQNARIRSERQGGAWCPKEPISQHSYEWLQVDLRLVHVITSIELQGRFAAGQGKEYAEWINIQFRRHNNSNWIAYPHRKFLRHMIASQIRIVPVSKLSRTVCLRFEVYGCIWRNGSSDCVEQFF
ncbi:hypothetical protein HELRODRAFT_167563 [Helobdella robusta]|uniref:F5/8 type C domain-containing protein n=1 Tax=Helobdella robusta TaxID=6412 RepID=T1EZH8_HELRO|nr:hypothetical protein HELRODRAFT_167563 [Helobdella robusta]ESO11043.1 hypothetical protein HELRODRAFT_167563 [Helobdella robusta]